MAEDASYAKSIEMLPETIEDSREQQLKNARAELRTRFLNVLFKMSRKDVSLKMKETNECVKAVFCGSDYSFEQIAVSELQTAIGKEAHSVVLSKDVISLTFSGLSKSQIN